MNYKLKFLGEIKGAYIAEKYNSGEIESLKLEELNRIVVNNTIFIPSYNFDSSRKKDMPSLRLYKSGRVKSIDLQEPALVQIQHKSFEVEKVVFYESGEIKRIFPLNGAISGFWTEEDEYKLAKEYSFDFEFSKFKSKVISVKFYKNGNIKSITLWPKDRISVKYKDKVIPVRTGFSVYEDGTLESIEPASFVKVHTPIGDIKAYDKNAIGIHGENNSLKFNRDGSVKSLITSSNIVKVINKKGEEHVYSPVEEYLYVNSLAKDLITLSLKFEDDKVIINGSDTFSLDDNDFIIQNFGEKKFTLNGDL